MRRLKRLPLWPLALALPRDRAQQRYAGCAHSRLPWAQSARARGPRRVRAQLRQRPLLPALRRAACTINSSSSSSSSSRSYC
jgi:hypothetical protein